MYLRLKDLHGNGYSVEATSTLEQTISADETLTLDIPYTEVNKDFIYQIRTFWEVQGVMGEKGPMDYVIKYINRSTSGNRASVEAIAKPKVLEDLRGTRIFPILECTPDTGIVEIMNFIFAPTHVKFQMYGIEDKNLYYDGLLGNGMSVFQAMKVLMEVWGLEILYTNDTVYFYNNLIRRPEYVLRDDLNLDGVTVEEDGMEEFTSVWCFGDIGSRDEPLSTAGVRLKVDHPLIEVIGRREAEPIVLPNSEILVEGEPHSKITVKYIEDILRKKAEELLYGSLKISVSADFLVLKEFMDVYPKVGDVVPFVSTKLKYQRELRLTKIVTTRDAKGFILRQDLTYGDLPLRDRMR